MKKMNTAGEPATYALDRSCKLCSAYFIGDGFDVSNGLADLSSGTGQWTSSGNSATQNTTTRFGVGRSFYYNLHNGDMLTKTGGPNDATWFAHVSMFCSATLNQRKYYIEFRDAGTAQVAISFVDDGTIKFYRGTVASGTLIATWSSAFVLNSYDSYQFKIVINGASGSVTARKNGAATDTFSATGLNTQATANAYANQVCIGHTEGTSFMVLDDFLCYTGSGVAPNDWVGDVRAIQLQPTLDTAQKQFTGTSSGSLSFGSSSTSGSNPSISANVVWIAPLTAPTQGGTFTTATAQIAAGFSGNLRYAIYASDGDVQGFVADNKPGYLLATSNTIVNPVTGVNTVTFPSPVPIQNGHTYFLGILSDTAFTHTGGGSLPAWYTYSPNPFASGFPSNLATLVSATSNRQPTFFTTLTANNSGYANDYLEDGATTYVQDSTVGHYDLYDLKDLDYVPAAIIGVNLRSYNLKSDAGGRGFKIAGFSGATLFETAEYNPLTTVTNFSQFYNTDPDTGIAWTSGAVNALQIGPKVSS